MQHQKALAAVGICAFDLNRRSVSVALAGLSLAISACIAVPIAMLRAADEVPPQKPEQSSQNSDTPRNVTDTPADDLPAEFRDELNRTLDILEVSAESQAEILEKKPAAAAASPDLRAGISKPANDQVQLKAKHPTAQSLFGKWQESARTDGKIPGALIGHVGREIDNFVKRHPQNEKTPKLAALRSRLDASQDWTQESVVAILDDITNISTSPVSWDATSKFPSSTGFFRRKQLRARLTVTHRNQPALLSALANSLLIVSRKI